MTSDSRGLGIAVRRRGVRWRQQAAGLLALALLVLLLARPRLMYCTLEVQPRAERPNIVVILADDLDLELYAQMHRAQAIAQKGERFPNAFVTSPVCCPSRVSLLTGRYPHNHGVLSNGLPDGGAGRLMASGGEGCMLPVWLQQAGYTTALVGKYLNQYGLETPPTYVPVGWNEWAALSGKPSYEDYTLNVNGLLEHPPQEQTVELADIATGLLARLPRPFFLYVAPWAPHLATSGRLMPIPAAITARAELAERLDLLVGRIVAALPADTYVIFTSDNGFHLRPAPGKLLPYDSDTRVPLFVMGPATHGEHAGIVLNIDIAPQIALWAGVSAPLVDGHPFGDHRAFLIERPAWRAIHTKTALYVEWEHGRRELIGHGNPDALAVQLRRLARCHGDSC